jgi:translation initiation factor 1 (eIF-1/SUI1)
MGNKTVTSVRGYEQFGLDGHVLAKDFQKRFASSATVSGIAGMPQCKEVVVQGHLADEVKGLLEAACGLPKNLMETKIGKGVKGKRK